MSENEQTEHETCDSCGAFCNGWHCECPDTCEDKQRVERGEEDCS